MPSCAWQHGNTRCCAHSRHLKKYPELQFFKSTEVAMWAGPILTASVLPRRVADERICSFHFLKVQGDGTSATFYDRERGPVYHPPKDLSMPVDSRLGETPQQRLAPTMTRSAWDAMRASENLAQGKSRLVPLALQLQGNPQAIVDVLYDMQEQLAGLKASLEQNRLDAESRRSENDARVRELRRLEEERALAWRMLEDARRAWEADRSMWRFSGIFCCDRFLRIPRNRAQVDAEALFGLSWSACLAAHSMLIVPYADKLRHIDGRRIDNTLQAFLYLLARLRMMLTFEALAIMSGPSASGLTRRPMWV